MQVTLHSTNKVVTINGVPARVWEGKTEGGVECFALVARIACSSGVDADASEFERELEACPPLKPVISRPLEGALHIPLVAVQGRRR